MKKRVPALVLALALALTVPAWAAQDTPDNFVRSKTYAGQFSDLTPESTFYDNVAALYEYGLSVGKADGTFGLRDQLTVGQVVIFAGRIRSLYRTGDAEAGPGAYAAEDEAAALRYLRYLQAEGVIGTELDESLSTPATRAQVAHVLANTLPEDALPAIHTDLVTQAYASRQFITDVTEYTPYYQDILTLYRTGVSVGSDAAGSFLPDQPITRGAAAAMLTRMVDPSLRATPDWDLGKESWSAQGAAMGDLVPLGTYIAAPATAAEMDESVRYMLASNQNTLVLQYPSLSVTSARRVMEAALAAVKTYCEQCYNTVNCTYSADGSITLTFSAASAGDQILTYRDAAMEAAIAGRSAAAYAARGEACPVARRVEARGGVRYVVPQRIRADAQGEIPLMLRVGDVYKDATLVARCGETILAKRKKRIFTPGEMETLPLDAQRITGDIIVEMEAQKA